MVRINLRVEFVSSSYNTSVYSINCSMYHFVIFIHILYFACTVGLGLRVGNLPPPPPSPFPEFIFHRAPKCLKPASIITQEVTETNRIN